MTSTTWASSSLDAILATASPFDDAFDPEILDCGEVVESLPVWTHCGRRQDLLARCRGWQVLSLREVIEDIQATWSGRDDAAWEHDAGLL
jgi:hypothetical protein